MQTHHKRFLVVKPTIANPVTATSPEFVLEQAAGFNDDRPGGGRSHRRDRGCLTAAVDYSKTCLVTTYGAQLTRSIRK